MKKSVAVKCEKEVSIVNELGIHARPAAMFVKLANTFTSEIFIEKDKEQVNGKSIMGIMMLAAGKGTKIIIRAEGEDADSAVDAIEKLITDKFGEE
ncbi:MAG: HPr family phosphocarrier protein [Candidatus Ancaeobacter aquaticus]|nr:HPr family phosphocarrier protein [Candidatus Ancaeobacter aquaticus]